MHLPWCISRCPYCDFNAYALDQPLAEAKYVDALLRDFSQELTHTGEVELSSIFFGGGTPSLFSAEAISRLLDGIGDLSRISDHCEITLEANPGSAEASRFRGYAQAGVNRLSLGVQSFDAARLSDLGRVHSVDEAQQAIEYIALAGIANFNIDIMFGLPNADLKSTMSDLESAIAANPAHISWYQLTLEPGTAFARKPPSLPSHDAICDAYDAGLVMLRQAGFHQYEISAHARKGRAARHNLNYWRFGDYIGIGAGAHGKINSKRRSAAGEDCSMPVRRHKIRSPARYMSVVANGGDIATEQAIARQDLIPEFMLNALRLADGFSWSEFSAATGLSPSEPQLRQALSRATERAWLCVDAERARPTELGFRFLNDLQLLFLPD